MGINVGRKIGITMVVAAAVTVSILVFGTADGVAPGSEQDPVVTQSYVEQKSGQLKYYIDDLVAKINEGLTTQGTDIATLKVQLEEKSKEIAALKAELAAGEKTPAEGQASGSGKFEVVKVAKGKTILGGEGSEIILRSGTCTAISGINGTLLDATVGKDLKAAEVIVKNHLLISSRNDGRGLKATAESYFIIKGGYTIK